MKSNNKYFFEDLCKYVFDPIRIIRLADKVGIKEYNYLESY